MKKVTIKWVDNPYNDDPQIEPGDEGINKENVYPIIRHVLQIAGNDIDILQTGISKNLKDDDMKTLVGRLIFEIPAGTIIDTITFDDTYEIQLYIYPRIDKEGDYDSINCYALIYMLKHVLPDIFISDTEAQSTILENDTLWNYLLVYQYEKKLIELNQLGFYSSYVKVEKNDDRVRGNIDFPRHIKLNSGLKNGRIAYNYRKRTTDNSLNRLILRTYELLRVKMPAIVDSVIKDNPAFASIISELRYQSSGYASVSDETIIKQNLKPMTHPYYMRYDSMRRLCLSIFRDKDAAPGLETDDEYKIRGYLINMNQLFEDFVKKAVLEKSFGTEDKMKVEEQYEIVLNEDGKLQHTAYKGEHVKGSIRPDFVVRSNQPDKDIIMVFDAKNKPGIYLEVPNNIKKLKKIQDEDIEKIIGDTVIVNLQNRAKKVPSGALDALGIRRIINYTTYFGNIGNMHSAIIAPIQWSEEGSIDTITNLFKCEINNLVNNMQTEIVIDLIRIPFPKKEFQPKRFEDYSKWEKEINKIISKLVKEINNHFISKEENS